MTPRPLKIGLSACFFHADPARPIFKGKTLQYMEQSMAHWVMASGAVPLMLPRPSGLVDVRMLVEEIDGLLLQGGSDVSPKTYGMQAHKPEWAGDRERDLYEIELLHECLRVGKPVLGICRGLQLINVALGGTLYQDLETQCPESQVHRDWNVYEDLHHEVVFEPGSRLHEFYPGKSGGRVNSIHHQAVMDLAEGLVIEARSVDDGIVEALHRPGPSYLYALQWHPEFIPAEAAELLSPDPIMGSFLSAAEEARA